MQSYEADGIDIYRKQALLVSLRCLLNFDERTAIEIPADIEMRCTELLFRMLTHSIRELLGKVTPNINRR